MISSLEYRKAFFFAIGLHLLLIVLLVSDNKHHSTLSLTAQKSPGMALPMVVPQQEPVKAVSIDNKEVMDTVKRLKEEKEQQKRAEINRQNELIRQAQAAKQQRIKEQNKIAQLKEEANRIAIARKKQVEEEKKHLKQLAEQKALETKRIEELKKQKDKLAKEKEVEAKKLAEASKKVLEQAREEKRKVDRAEADKLKAQEALRVAEAEERKRQLDAAAQQQAAQNAEKQALIAGEVDKYKALIVNAIGRNWILPENVDSRLSSQFRIRLAPDGMVLEVSLIRSSGDPLLDRSAQTAIYKASPLPVPTDANTFNLFRDISLTVRPEHVRG
jgi:colicin import membrane protein